VPVLLTVLFLSAVTGEPHSMARVGDFLGLFNSEFYKKSSNRNNRNRKNSTLFFGQFYFLQNSVDYFGAQDFIFM
jgi:hypothetical protein